MTITKQTTRSEFTDTSANFNVAGSYEKLRTERYAMQVVLIQRRPAMHMRGTQIATI